MILRTGIAVALLFLALANTASGATVRTVAGSGIHGIADGDARHAEFMMPMGVAADGSGNIYVTDGAAQRIRKIDLAGNVTTIAGGGEPSATPLWIAGGYLDAVGTAARFNRPAGIAAAPDGTLYVADTYNNCVRVIAPGGRVTTLPGSTSLVEPVGIARAGNGDLYVSGGAYVREFDAKGTITAIKFPPYAVLAYGGIAVADSPQGTTIFLADATGLLVKRADGSQQYFRNSEFTADCQSASRPAWLNCDVPVTLTRDGRNVGYPFALAALDDHTVVYTDITLNSIRILDTTARTVRVIGGSLLEDMAARNAGYADGDGVAARFNSPTGIAAASNGQLLISDAGSLRIRSISGLRADRFGPELRIGAQQAAYVGGSFIWQGSRWADSIEGQTEAAVLHDAGKVLHVVPVDRANFSSLSGQLDRAGPSRWLAIVLDLCDADVSNLHASIAQPLLYLKTTLQRSGTKFAVLYHPVADELSPSESLWRRLHRGDVATEPSRHRAVIAALRNANIEVIDVWPAFESAEHRTHPRPLFAMDEMGFAPLGRELVSNALSRYLERLR